MKSNEEEIAKNEQNIEKVLTKRKILVILAPSKQMRKK